VPSREDRVVTARSFAHLQLEVDLDADPIAGSVKDGDRTDMQFSGWMELTRTIELSVDQVRARRIPSQILPPRGASHES
jgi:hypothetical protein